MARTMARVLRARRKELGLTQEQVALAMNVDRNTYLLMESARSDRPTNSTLNSQLRTLMLAAHVLQLSAQDLFGEAQRIYEAGIQAEEESYR